MWKGCYQFIEQYFYCGRKMNAISKILSTNKDKEKLCEDIRCVYGMMVS